MSVISEEREWESPLGSVGPSPRPDSRRSVVEHRLSRRERGLTIDSRPSTHESAPYRYRNISRSLSHLVRAVTNLSARTGTAASLAAPPSAKPQVVRGRDVWPEHWGITRRQLKELLGRLKDDPAWDASNNVYALVNDFIVPWTKDEGSGCSYALSLNLDDPKEVNLMASHAWFENAEEFIETLVRTITNEDVLFVCALSLYQAEDGAGPSIVQQLGSDPMESPFRRVLEHIRLKGLHAGIFWRWHAPLSVLPPLCIFIGVLLFLVPVAVWGCVPIGRTCATADQATELARMYRWDPLPAWQVWTLLPLIFCGSGVLLRSVFGRLIYQGRMVVVPNRQCDVYSRLWCVYEIYVASKLGIRCQVALTLAAAGSVSSRYATCGSSEDYTRIRGEIEQRASYRSIDRAVYLTTHGNVYKAALAAVVIGSTIAFFDVLFGKTTAEPGEGSIFNLLPHPAILIRYQDLAVFVGCVILAKISSYFAIFSLFFRSQGIPVMCKVRRRSAELIALGLPFLLVGTLFTLSDDVPHAWTTACFFAGVIMTGYAGGLWGYGWALLHYPRQLRLYNTLQAIVAMCVLIFILILLARIVWVIDQPTNAARMYMVCSGSLIVTFGDFFLPMFVFWYMAHHWGFEVQLSNKNITGNGDEEGSSSSDLELDDGFDVDNQGPDENDS